MNAIATPKRRFSLPVRALARMAGVTPIPEGAPIETPGFNPDLYDLDAPFLWLNRHDFLSKRDVYEHCLVLSETGGGKTSGPGKFFLFNYLIQQFSGICLCYKSDDSDRIIEAAWKCGRFDDLIVVSPQNGWTCNVLDWEFSRPGLGAGHSESIASLLWEILENVTPSGKRDGDSFFTTGARRLAKFGLEAMQAAGERVTMPGLKAIIDGIPSRQGSNGQLAWAEDSYLRECLWKAEQRGSVNPAVQNYFLKEFTRTGGERQSAGVISTFTHAADFFLDPTISRLFFEETTFTPEDALKGKIVVLALPVTEYGAMGKAAQILFKAAFIKQALRRQGLPYGHRPSFVYIDEYQQFSSEMDTLATEAGRSSQLSFFVLSQNLPNLYKAMDASRAHDVVDALVGNFGTLIFGRQKCRATNNFAQETIQRAMTIRRSGGDSSGSGTSKTIGLNSGSSHGWGSGGQGGNSSHNYSYGESVSRTVSGNRSENQGWRQEMDWSCPAETFLGLRGGGPPDYLVDTVLVKASKRFAGNQGRPWMPVSWPQNAQATERGRAPRRKSWWGRKR